MSTILGGCGSLVGKVLDYWLEGREFESAASAGPLSKALKPKLILKEN